MRKLVLLVCVGVLSVACSENSEPNPQAVPTPTATQAPAPDPACPNQEAVVADGSLRAGDDLPGDFDGDGAPDSVSIYFDPNGEEGCQAFVVAELFEGDPISGPLETWRSDYGLPRPTLNAVLEIDGSEGAEVVVNMGIGASTQFVGIVTEDEGRLVQVLPDVAAGEMADGMFGFGGSVGHVSAVDCAAGDMVVASFATPRGRDYEVERTFFDFDGPRLVRVDREVERVRLAQIGRLTEFALSPFGGC